MQVAQEVQHAAMEMSNKVCGCAMQHCMPLGHVHSTVAQMGIWDEMLGYNRSQNGLAEGFTAQAKEAAAIGP